MAILSITKLSKETHQKLLKYTYVQLEEPKDLSITLNITTEMKDFIESRTDNKSELITEVIEVFLSRNIIPMSQAFSRSEIVRFVLFDWYIREMEIIEEENQKEQPKPYIPNVIRTLEQTIKKTPHKPWVYTKPKKFLDIFPKEINLNLTVSHLHEHGNKLTPKELKSLMGYNSNQQYYDINSINAIYPELIHKSRGFSNRIDYYMLDEVLFQEILKKLNIK